LDQARVRQALQTNESLLPQNIQQKVYVGFLIVNDQKFASFDNVFTHSR
jgi:hypothetical protein